MAARAPTWLEPRADYLAGQDDVSEAARPVAASRRILKAWGLSPRFGAVRSRPLYGQGLA
ncbi:hypothetical protein CHELA17_62347 [Chelatococcus asaccharovorans]|nr:hypothetical protein CHELA17_62347 [Chelatococcus asaccharovorans]